MTLMMKTKALGVLLALSSAFASPTIMSESKRLNFSVSKNGMTRIKVMHDRIINVYIDDETIIFDTDPLVGQVFVRMNEHNSTKPIYLTIFTEAGQEQDLKLTPEDIPVKTISMIAPDEVPQTKPIVQVGMEGSEPNPSVVAMKNLVTSSYEHKVCKGCSKNHTNRENAKLVSCKHLSDGQIGLIFDIKNESDKAITLKEENYFREHDQTLSIKNCLLTPKDSTQLFVVRGSNE